MLFSPSVIWLDLILKERHFLFPRELEQVMFYEKKNFIIYQNTDSFLKY